MKEIIFTDRNGGTWKALVVGCVEGIGITIVAKDNKNNFLLCLVGVSSPLWLDAYDEDKSKKSFEYLSARIEEGEVDARELVKKFNPIDLHLTSRDCSFAQ